MISMSLFRVLSKTNPTQRAQHVAAARRNVARLAKSHNNTHKFCPNPPVAANRILEGSMAQPWLMGSWAAEQFETEFQAMTDVKMDHFIWQFTVNSTPGIMQAYYPTTMCGFKQRPKSQDAVGASLAAAQKKKLQVWLGLNRSSDWNKHFASDNGWLKNEFDIGLKTAKELWSFYGPNGKYGTYTDTIAGFYSPFEVDNVNFSTKTAQDWMADVYKKLSNGIYEITKGNEKGVMVSPFFNDNACEGQTPDVYACMWENILDRAPLDVVAVQDGIGAHHATVTAIGLWLKPLKAAVIKRRPERPERPSKFWVNLETFDEITPGTRVPAPFCRVIKQIKAEQDYAQKFTTFSFNHYNSPNLHPTYADWKKHTDAQHPLI